MKHVLLLFILTNVWIITIAQTTLNVTVSSPPLIKKGVHSSCAVDISWVCNGTCSPGECDDFTYFDINSNTTHTVNSGSDATYKSLMADLNFNAIQYSGGSTSDFDRYSSGHHGNGYNIIQADLDSPCGQTGCSEIRNKGLWNFSGHDFYEDYLGLVDYLDVDAALIADVQRENLTALKYRLDKANTVLGKYPKRVIFGMEQSLGDNDCFWGVWDHSTNQFGPAVNYKSLNNSWYNNLTAGGSAYAGITYGFDAAKCFSSANRYSDWNTGLNNSPIVKGQEGRLYLWDDDLGSVLWSGGTTIDSYSKIDSLFTPAATKYIDKFVNTGSLSFKNTFSGFNPAIWQWGIKQSNTNLYEKLMGVVYMARFYIWMMGMNNDGNGANDIQFASFQNMLKLMDIDISGSPYFTKTPFYEGMKLVGALFSDESLYQYTYTLKTGGTDVTGIYGMATGTLSSPSSNKYFVLLVNENGSSQEINILQVNGTNKNNARATITTLTESGGSLVVTADVCEKFCSGCGHPVVLPATSVSLLVFDGTSTYCAVRESSPNLAASNAISVYPNPATQEVSVQLNNDLLGRSLQIVDASGRILTTVDMNGQTVKADLSVLPQGIYFLEVTCNDGSKLFQKMIKQ